MSEPEKVIDLMAALKESLAKRATPEPSATAQPSEPNVCTCRPADSNIWDCPVHGAPTPSAPQADDVGASGAGVVDETTVRDGFDVLPMEQWTAAELIDYISGDYDYTATELTKRFASLRAEIDRLRGEVHKGNMDAARLRADRDRLERERDTLREDYGYLTDLNESLVRKVVRLERELEEARGALRVRFACPLCGTVNEPTRGEIVMGEPYRCDECMTALVFSVASPELDAERAVEPGEGAPQW